VSEQAKPRPKAILEKRKEKERGAREKGRRNKKNGTGSSKTERLRWEEARRGDRENIVAMFPYFHIIPE
jgi:hypothetical protein